MTTVEPGARDDRLWHSLERIAGAAAIVAPALHLTSDVMEWMAGGFSRPQLLINYAGFVAMPAMILGLYAVQRPRIAVSGLLGALLYGFAFIYFSHTTLLALSLETRDYETLWQSLGVVYTFHGGLMVIGGLLFGAATLRERVLPAWSAWCFIAGLIINLVLAFLPVPAILETLGSTLRNIGVIGMGAALLTHRRALANQGEAA